MTEVEAFDRTLFQLGISAIAVFPYILITEDIGAIHLETFGLIMLLFVGIVHTGVAYMLYFNSIKNLPAQTIAILSYLDPVIAIILSVVILRETLGIYGLIGAILILGSTFISEKS